MKKVTKGLIIAASVAAVVGVGAVSFAAWTASTDTSVTINNGVTGQIATVGAITVTPDSDSGSVSGGVYSMNKLCPVDQTDESKPTDCVKFWKFTLSSDATGGQEVKYTILGTLTAGAAADNGTALGSAGLRWLDGDTAPSAATDGTALSATTAADITGTTVYVFLTANSTEAMNAKISVTFAAVEA